MDTRFFQCIYGFLNHTLEYIDCTTHFPTIQYVTERKKLQKNPVCFKFPQSRQEIYYYLYFYLTQNPSETAKSLLVQKYNH